MITGTEPKIQKIDFTINSSKILKDASRLVQLAFKWTETDTMLGLPLLIQNN
jgi:hypothetical protein